jgi:hypothetical protein
MKAIEVSPELVLRYAKLNRNEVVLHMAIRSLGEDGKLKRNIYRLAQILGKDRGRVYEAEFQLKRKRLLQVHYVREGTRDVPYWYVYERPVGQEPTSVVVKTEAVVYESQKPMSIWRKFRNAIVGTDLDDFSLTD